jgi:hypothetical protein
VKPSAEYVLAPLGNRDRALSYMEMASGYNLYTNTD